ncbi:MAG: TetR/AcrR family transcriptional regulator [Brevirhabdus sp.]
MSKSETPPSNRDRILESALSCFVENGLQRTGMREIARHAGVSLGNLYNHFSGKDDLIAEIAQIDGARIEALLAEIDENAPPLATLHHLLSSVMDDAAQPAHAVLAIDLTAEAVRNPDVAAAFSGSESQLHNAVAALVSRISGDNEKSAQAMAKALLDMAEAIGMRCALDPQFTRKDAKAVLPRLLKGLRADDAD